MPSRANNDVLKNAMICLGGWKKKQETMVSDMVWRWRRALLAFTALS
jgi:hypothetical protein